MKTTFFLDDILKRTVKSTVKRKCDPPFIHQMEAAIQMIATPSKLPARSIFVDHQHRDQAGAADHHRHLVYFAVWVKTWVDILR